MEPSSPLRPSVISAAVAGFSILIASQSFFALPAAEPCVPAFQLVLESKASRDAFTASSASILANYQHTLRSSTSHHFYIRTAPRAVREAAVDAVWPPKMQAALTSRFPPGTRFLRDPFDEIFISRRNLDYAGDHGLYTLHYDGLLRLPLAPVCTLRTISYLSGPAARFFAVTSGRNFSTDANSTVTLDFNAEIHFVDVPPTDRTPRLALKSNLHVVPPGTPRFVELMTIAAHRLVFFVVKATMEKTKGGASSSHKLFGIVFNNGFRLLNNVHLLLSLPLAAAPVIALLASLLRFPLYFASYVINIYAITARGASVWTVAALSFTARSISQIALLRAMWLKRHAAARRRWLTTVGSVLFISGSCLHAVAFSQLGWAGTYYGRELGVLSPDWVVKSWPYDESISHPMHTAITMEMLGVLIMFGTAMSKKMWFVVVMQVAWTWVVALFEENAETSFQVLAAPVQRAF